MQRQEKTGKLQKSNVQKKEKEKKMTDIYLH